MRVQQAQAFVKSKAPEPQRKQTEQQLPAYEHELNSAREVLKRFEEFEQLLDKTKPRLNVRLLYRADGSDVTLLQIGE
jgi:hypothetical protein